MFSTDGGIPICKVNDGNPTDEIIFFSEIDKSKSKLISGPKVVKLHDGVFEPLPNEKIRVKYIAGPSGVGKSVYTSTYAKNYKGIYPEARIILFSRVDDDPAFKDLLYKKVDLKDKSIADNPIQLEEVIEDTLVIFDDVDTISDAKLLKSLMNFQAQVLEMGRHKNVNTCITSHLINGNDRKQCRTILNELQSLTIFPRSGSVHQIRYVLDHYFGLSYKQCSSILNMDSRWVTLYKNHPQLLISETQCMLLSSL